MKLLIKEEKMQEVPIPLVIEIDSTNRLSHISEHVESSYWK